jgi:heavy-metal-associated domain-containing protein
MIMKVTPSYIHALDGRLRIKAPTVKGSPARGLEVESRLRQVDGIDHVTANPTTGNILILYTSCRIAQHEVLDILHTLGCLQEQPAAKTGASDSVETRPSFSETLGEALTESLVRSTVELALQRLISALI